MISSGYNDEQNRKKLAEEAKRDAHLAQEKQKAQEKHALQLKLSNLKFDLEKYKRELQTKETNLRGIKSEEEATRIRINSERSVETKTETEKNELQAQLVKLNDELRRINSDLSAQENKLRIEEMNHEAEKRDLADHNFGVEKKQGEIEALKMKIDGLNRDLQKSQTEEVKEETDIKVETKEEVDLKRKIDDLQAELVKLTNELKSKERVHEDVKKKAAASRLVVDQKQREIAELKIQLERLNRDIENTEKGVGKEKKDISMEEREETDVKRRIVEKKSLAERTQRYIDEVKAKLTKIANSFSAQSGLVVKEKQEENKEAVLAREISEIRNKMQSVEREIDTNTQKISQIM